MRFINQSQALANLRKCRKIDWGSAQEGEAPITDTKARRAKSIYGASIYNKLIFFQEILRDMPLQTRWHLQFLIQASSVL